MRRSWRSYRSSNFIVLWGMVIVTLLLSGCGRKAPPMAPSEAPFVAIDDLKVAMDNGFVRLTWSHLPENDKAAGYIVLRAQSALSKPACPDCPQVYQKVGKVPVGRIVHDQRVSMEYYHEVGEGFEYTFNVRPYASSAEQGPDSNLVVIAYTKQ